MTIAPKSFRHQLMLAGACGLALCCTGTNVARADASSTQVNLGLGQEAATAQSESVLVRAQRRLLKEKDSPSAVTELGQKQIAAVGISGSTATLLRQAPSVYVYQQGIGDDAPVLTIRGLRGLEVAQTLDGVPIQDLLAPDAFYLSNNIGAVVTNGQIAGVHIYPGVAYPDKNTFGTIGGTVAFDSKRPSDDFHLDVSGEVGSFQTYASGFELNSGGLDSGLGSGDDALKLLLSYKQLQTAGYIDYTPNRENEMEFALDKPYNDGLSKFQATVLYNNARALIQNEPVPVLYLQKYGNYTNYPVNDDFVEQHNDYLTLILKDDTYINDYLNVGLSAFYIANNNTTEDYSNINIDVPGGVTPTGGLGFLKVGQAAPFINNPGGFAEGGLYGPPRSLTPGDPLAPLGIFDPNGGYGGYFYGQGHKYDPYKLYPVGSKECPAQFVATYGGAAFAPCGLNDQTVINHSDTYGIQPRATIDLPELFGINNTIKIGGLLAKETSPSGVTYLGGDPHSPLDLAHQLNTIPTGGTERQIFQAYAQDKIDLFDNTLHLTPGITAEGTASSFTGSFVRRSALAPYYGANGACGPNGYLCGNGNGTGLNIDRYGPYTANKWDREYLPFFNVSYDFDKMVPALTGLTAYGSIGQSALFAPVGDFGPNTAGAPPYASIVHMYEGGVKYDTSKLLVTADYFYQKVDRDFGFYSSQTGTNFGKSVYSNAGLREFKGVEASIVYQVTPEIQLFGNVSHLLAKYLTSSLSFDTVAEDQYGIAVKGTPISGIPDWLSTFGADYSHKSFVLDNDAFDIRLTGQYTGHQYTTCDLGLLNPSCGPLVVKNVPGVAYTGPNADTFDTFTGATTTDPNGGINPYVTFNLDANYKLPTPQLPVLKFVTFDVNIQNLFNKFYYQYFYKQVSPVSCPRSAIDPTGNPYGCTKQFSDAIPGQPFSIFFTVTARF